MRYPITIPTRRLLNDIDALARDARSWLGLASPAARVEWSKLEARLPSSGERDTGSITISEDGLREIEAKIRRFRDIMSGSNAFVHPTAPAPLTSSRFA